MVKEAYLAVTEGLLVNISAGYFFTATIDRTYIVFDLVIGIWLYLLSILVHVCLNIFRKTGMKFE